MLFRGPRREAAAGRVTLVLPRRGLEAWVDKRPQSNDMGNLNNSNKEAAIRRSSRTAIVLRLRGGPSEKRSRSRARRCLTRSSEGGPHHREDVVPSIEGRWCHPDGADRAVMCRNTFLGSRTRAGAVLTVLLTSLAGIGSVGSQAAAIPSVVVTSAASFNQAVATANDSDEHPPSRRRLLGSADQGPRRTALDRRNSPNAKVSNLQIQNSSAVSISGVTITPTSTVPARLVITGSSGVTVTGVHVDGRTESARRDHPDRPHGPQRRGSEQRSHELREWRTVRRPRAPVTSSSRTTSSTTASTATSSVATPRVRR